MFLYILYVCFVCCLVFILWTIVDYIIKTKRRDSYVECLSSYYKICAVLRQMICVGYDQFVDDNDIDLTHIFELLIKSHKDHAYVRGLYDLSINKLLIFKADFCHKRFYPTFQRELNDIIWSLYTLNQVLLFPSKNRTRPNILVSLYKNCKTLNDHVIQFCHRQCIIYDEFQCL